MRAIAVLLVAGCSAAPLPCARYGTLEAEYGAALQEACGDLLEDECKRERPGAVEGVDERFRPKFEEAESCQ